MSPEIAARVIAVFRETRLSAGANRDLTPLVHTKSEAVAKALLNQIVG